MKILHCSDIHLGKKPFGREVFSEKRYEDYFSAFNQVVEKAIEIGVEVFLIAGDLFDKKELTPDILRKSEEIFEKLKFKNIKTIVIEGNHDNSIKGYEIDSWLKYLEKKELCTRLAYEKDESSYTFQSLKIGDVNFYGVGYPSFNVDNVVLELEKVLNGAEKNIVLIHTAIGGGESNVLPGLVNTDSLKSIRDKVIYIGGGHYHSKSVYPAENPFFFIPGSTEYWNILNEKSNEKGFFIFDTETREAEFILINPRKRVKVDYKVESIKEKSELSCDIKEISENENFNKNSFLEKFENFCKNLNLTGEELVIVNLIITGNSYVDTKSLEEILENCGALKGYVVPNFVGDNLSMEETDTSESSIYSIEREVLKSWVGFGNVDLIPYLSHFKEFQQNGDGELFFETFDKMLDEVIKDENK